jgi:hypothetical protein
MLVLLFNYLNFIYFILINQGPLVTGHSSILSNNNNNNYNSNESESQHFGLQVPTPATPAHIGLSSRQQTRTGIDQLLDQVKLGKVRLS